MQDAASIATSVMLGTGPPSPFKKTNVRASLGQVGLVQRSVNRLGATPIVKRKAALVDQGDQCDRPKRRVEKGSSQSWHILDDQTDVFEIFLDSPARKLGEKRVHLLYVQTHIFGV